MGTTPDLETAKSDDGATAPSVDEGNTREHHNTDENECTIFYKFTVYNKLFRGFMISQSFGRGGAVDFRVME